MKTDTTFDGRRALDDLAEAYRLHPDVQFGVAVLVLAGLAYTAFHAFFRFVGEVGKEWE